MLPCAFQLNLHLQSIDFSGMYVVKNAVGRPRKNGALRVPASVPSKVSIPSTLFETPDNDICMTPVASDIEAVSGSDDSSVSGYESADSCNNLLKH